MLKGYEVTRGKPTEQISSVFLQDPLFTIILDSVPSWNEILYLPPRARAGEIRRERNKGYKIGLSLGKLFNIPIKAQQIKKNAEDLRGSYLERLIHPVTENKLFCLLSIWRQKGVKDATKGNRKRDIYNAATKALLDGLTDAGVWEDDNELYHTDYYVRYMGVADSPRAEISFYET